MIFKILKKLRSFYKIKVYRKKTDWVENSVIFGSAVGKQQISSQPKSHLGTSYSKNKHYWYAFVVTLTSLFILGRLVQLQIMGGKNYRKLAENNRQRTIPIPAERGHFFDINGEQLTKNIPNFSLALVPQLLPTTQAKRAELVGRLAKITGQDEGYISDLIKRYGSYRYESIVIQEDLAYDQAISIYIQLADLPGIEIQQGSKRLYLLDAGSDSSDLATTTISLSHILGYEGKLSPDELGELYSAGYLPSDSIGKTGVEKVYEKYLRGTYGKRRVEVNAVAKVQSVLEEKEPTLGHHIKLSLDINIQKNLERILSLNLKSLNKNKGVAIVVDPNSGEILAMVSLPAYNNNNFSGGIDSKTYKNYLDNEARPLFNRAISGAYPSGSTIKPAMAAAALQEGIINETTSFLSNGGVSVGVWFFPDWQFGGHGVTNVRKSLAWSVNTFYYYIGGGYNNFVGLGVAKISEYLKTFGFSQILGIDLPSEQPGFLPSKEWKEETKGERWYIGDTYNLSIGQGDLLATPLQIAIMTAAVANGGTVYTPRVAHGIIDPVTGFETLVEKSVVHENIISKDNLQIVRLGMRDCVVYGSCRRLADLEVLVAGKTGTAQWNSNKDNHAWFTSFAPYKNPEIVLTILIEEGGEGSSAAVPVAYDFYKWWEGYKKR